MSARPRHSQRVEREEDGAAPPDEKEDEPDPVHRLTKKAKGVSDKRPRKPMKATTKSRNGMERILYRSDASVNTDEGKFYSKTISD